MKNVKLKNTIWHIYKEELRNILAVSILIGLIYMVYSKFTDILSVIYIIFDNIKSLFNSMCTFTVYYTNHWCVFTSCIIVLILTLRFIIFLFYQQYIPLTESELKDNNITNVSEYFAFLSSKMMGFIPVKFLYPICLSAYKYLMDASEKKEIYDKYYEEITHKIESHPNKYSDKKILSIQEIDNYVVETDVNKTLLKMDSYVS